MLCLSGGRGGVVGGWLPPTDAWSRCLVAASSGVARVSRLARVSRSSREGFLPLAAPGGRRLIVGGGTWCLQG